MLLALGSHGATCTAFRSTFNDKANGVKVVQDERAQDRAPIQELFQKRRHSQSSANTPAWSISTAQAWTSHPARSF
jgi:hypothetical protein